MFEYADRDNPVETPVEFAIIGEPERWPPVRPRSAAPAWAELGSRQSEAGHARAAKAGRINRHAVKAAADIEDALAGFDQEFAAICRLFGELRSFEILAVAFEL